MTSSTEAIVFTLALFVLAMFHCYLSKTSMFTETSEISILGKRQIYELSVKKHDTHKLVCDF